MRQTLCIYVFLFYNYFLNSITIVALCFSTENIQNPSSPDVTITTGTPFSVTLHRMQTFLFGALAVDITGTSIVSKKPLVLSVVTNDSSSY